MMEELRLGYTTADVKGRLDDSQVRGASAGIAQGHEKDHSRPNGDRLEPCRMCTSGLKGLRDVELRMVRWIATKEEHAQKIMTTTVPVAA